MKWFFFARFPSAPGISNDDADTTNTRSSESPLGQIKLAHQFWFSYPPPGAGGSSSNSKSSQTDEEKQRERQRNEREQKNAEQEAINYKRERDAREARLLDFEIKRAQEKDRKKEIERQHLIQQQQQQYKQPSEEEEKQNQSQQQHKLQTTSNNQSFEGPLERGAISSSSVHFGDHKSSRAATQKGSTTIGSKLIDIHTEGTDQYKTKELEVLDKKDLARTTPSPQTLTGPPPSHSVVAGPPATAAAATAAIIPILPLGVAALRDDSTESDQSLTFSHSQSDVYHRIMCRAPIASLDCMEEFSGTGGHLDFGRSISLGSNPALPLRHGSTPTPGLRYKNLGKSGLRVSNVGLGTWPVFSPGVTEEQAETILKLAIESGINLFDISEAHSETELGKIIQRSGWKRSSFVIATKVYWSIKSEERGLSRKHIIESVKASLQRLQLQYIDIVIIHKADSMCPMEEVVRAMTYVIQQGWAMYWGTARWSQVEIMEAYTNCRQFNCITPIVEQAEYHMFCREKAELYLPEMYNKIGVGLMAWGPLSMALSDTQNGEKILFPKGSFKTKTHSYSWTEDEVNKNGFGWTKDRAEEGRRHSDRLRDLSNLAEKLGCSPTQLSIAWSLKHEPVQCLLLGATSAEQLHQSLQALQLLPRLSTSVMLELERILENKPVRPPPISTLALR